jgi:hypothetical protein
MSRRASPHDGFLFHAVTLTAPLNSPICSCVSIIWSGGWLGCSGIASSPVIVYCGNRLEFDGYDLLGKATMLQLRDNTAQPDRNNDVSQQVDQDANQTH